MRYMVQLIASFEFRVGKAVRFPGADMRVKGGRSPATRTLDAHVRTNTLKGSGWQALRGLPPSQSGGEDFPALGGVRGGVMGSNMSKSCQKSPT